MIHPQELATCLSSYFVGFINNNKASDIKLVYLYSKTHEITQHISRKLVRMDVLTSEKC
jgi:hypothetical protein